MRRLLTAAAFVVLPMVGGALLTSCLPQELVAKYEAQFSQIDGKVAALELERQSLLEKLKAGELTVADFDAQVAALNERVATLASEKTTLEASLAQAKAEAVDAAVAAVAEHVETGANVIQGTASVVGPALDGWLPAGAIGVGLIGKIVGALGSVAGSLRVRREVV